MTRWLPVFYRQAGIEQQHASLGPHLQRTIVRNGLIQVTLQLLEDVAQGGRDLHARRHRERQTLRLVGPVVRVLTQNDHFDLRQRRELQRPQRMCGINNRASI